MILKLLPILYLLTWSSVWSLEAYQGDDYEVKSWRCGAPLVLALRKSDPDGLLKDPGGKLLLKESLEEISKNNLSAMRKQLGKLSSEETALIKKIESDDFEAPIVHRTDLSSSRIILTNGEGMVSATKRRAAAKVTPGIEEQLFSGRDCIFMTVAPPYGTSSYGTVLLRLKENMGFAWGSILTGWTWTKEVAGRSVFDPATDEMKRKFSRQIFTNNHWDEALALQIIGHVRKGTSIRNKGVPYDKGVILGQLLQINNKEQFWKKVVRHRLAYLEAHYTDNIKIDAISFVQYRFLDQATVRSWNFPRSWFTGSNSFIQYFNRVE